MDNTTRTDRPAYYYGTGRRKSAIARVRLYPGNGQIIINSNTPEDYFGGRTMYRQMIEQPLALTDNASKFNVTVKVLGGGVLLVFGGIGMLVGGLLLRLRRRSRALAAPATLD